LIESGANMSLDRVAFGFPARPSFLGPLSAELHAGECWGVVGPNGAGKSTLLRLAAGLHTPTSGHVLLDGTPLSRIASPHRARSIAFLPQNPSSDFPLPAGDVVLMGRFPHRRGGFFEGAADRSIARSVMDRTRTRSFESRMLSTLSGGEAQRVHLAAAMAQQPRVLLLDEPTASLDLRHELDIFGMLRELAVAEGLLVLVVTHDLNLAARFCTHALLLDDGRLAAIGCADDVLTPEVLAPIYGVELSIAATADGAMRVLTASRISGTGLAEK